MRESIIAPLSFRCDLKRGESQASQEVRWEGWSARLRAVRRPSAARGWMYKLAECHPTPIPKLLFHLTIALWL